MEKKEMTDEEKLELIKKQLMTTITPNSDEAKKSAKKEKTEKNEKTEKKKSTKKTTKKTSTKKDKTKTKKDKKKNKNEIEAETDITTSRKWNDNKTNESNLIKGKFTVDEEKLIIDAFCEYGHSNNLDENAMLNLITEKQTKTDKNVWSTISEVLPNRSVQSIHNFCHRKFDPYNHKGAWTKEEERKLLLLYEEHNNKWIIIAKELERTPTNVRDKFKNIGGKNYKLRSNEFTLQNCLKLLKYIQDWVNNSDDSEVEKNSYEIFKYDYKFKKNLESEINAVYCLVEEKNKFLIDTCIKESPSRVIIKNILKLVINFKELARLSEDKVEISWSFISDKFVIYSALDCKNNFEKVFRELDLVSMVQIKRDLKMLRQIENCQYDSIDEVNFTMINNKR